MGFCKWFLKRVKCVSKCSFNNNEFDFEMLKQKLNDKNIKKKHIQKISTILSKRKKKLNVKIEI